MKHLTDKELELLRLIGSDKYDEERIYEDIYNMFIIIDSLRAKLQTAIDSNLHMEFKMAMRKLSEAENERDSLRADNEKLEEKCFQLKTAVDKATAIIKERDLLLKEYEALRADRDSWKSQAQHEFSVQRDIEKERDLLLKECEALRWGMTGPGVNLHGTLIGEALRQANVLRAQREGK